MELSTLEQQTENQRLKILMNKLGYFKQRPFADRLGITQGTISKMMKKDTPLPVSKPVKYKLREIFKVNIDWLTTGVGELFLKKEVEDKSELGVPFYSIDIAKPKGTLQVMMDEDVEYYVNYKPFNDCTAYLTVYGDSMYPRYASGEIIAVKEVKNYDVILWGEAYVVLADDSANALRSIKTLHEHSDHEKLVLKSTNINFSGDIIINKSAILALYIIKGKITRNMN